jgi:urocanate hydratase
VPLSAPIQNIPELALRVAQAYAQLTARGADPESGLGGSFFYAGRLDDAGRALVVAANIAGAATLAASADRTAQKQAIRDGIADFLVTSLDEALRILKNQLRKRETVAVCVAMEPAAMEREMRERGVLPNLLRSDVPIAADSANEPALVVWRVDSGRHKDLALLDEAALACLSADQWAARRWLRLAPRYLGRLAQGLHLLLTDRAFARRFAEESKNRVDRGEIAFPCELCVYTSDEEKKYRLTPEKS